MIKLLFSLFFTGIVCVSVFSQAEPQKGFPANVTGDIYSKVKVYDIDGDGKKEMIFGATDGMVHVFNHDGSERRNGLWPKRTGGPILGGVTVKDIDGDGEVEIVAGSFDGHLYVLGPQGNTKWKKNTYGSIVLGDPVVGDVNNDGQLDITVLSQSKDVNCYDMFGRGILTFQGTSKLSGTPVVTDLDGDMKNEIIYNSDSGHIEVIDSYGNYKKGFPKSSGYASGFYPFEPTVADIDGDGRKEIIVGVPTVHDVVIYNSEGEIKKKFKVSGDVQAGFNVVDIDKNGHPDIIFAQEDGRINIVDLNKTLNSNEDGPVTFPGWPKEMEANLYGLPQVADIDGDGELDIIFTGWDPQGTAENSGFVTALRLNGDLIPGFPKFIGKVYGTVTIADLDGDGDLEIIAPGGIGFTGPQLNVFDAYSKTILKFAILGAEYKIK